MATPPDKKKLKGFKEFDPSKYIDTEPTIKEAVMKNTVVVSFGRMNPITVGHEKLIDKVTSEANRLKADPMVFLTHSQDAKKNPLSYDDKVKFAKKAFGNTIQKSAAKTIIDVAKSLSGKYKNFVMVVGSDRVDEFQKMLSKYNGKEFSFETISMVSAGERDPDAEGVEGMSASKMRALAADKNIKDFSKGLPKKLQSSAPDIMAAVRKGMNMTEETAHEYIDEALNRQQRRQRSIAMRKNRFKIRRGKQKSERKTASREILMKRARKAAINILKKKFSKNRPYEELSSGEKEVIDKRVEKISKRRIDSIARKLMPVVKQRERDRRASANASASGAPKNESINEASYKDTRVLKRPHQLMDSNNKPKFDARFRMFKKKNVNENVSAEHLVEELADFAQDMDSYMQSLDEKTLSATKKAVNTVGPDGKTRTVWKRTNAVRTDDHGQDKLSTSEAKLPHALDPNKSLKHARIDRMVDKDTDGDTDKFDKQNIPDEITGDEKINQTPKMLKKNAGELKHTRKGVAYEDYYKGVPANKKDDRASHFKRNAEKADNDASAYAPAPGDSDVKTKESKHTKNYRKMYGENMVEENIEISEDATVSLKKKADKTGMPLGVLRKVFNRGMAAWKTGHRPGTTPEQWAHARVNSFVTKSSGTWGGADKDLASQVRKEAVELSELSNTTLASYKKKAGDSASAADKAGNFPLGNKRFSGIIKATKKQFANDAKNVSEATFKVDIQGLPAMFIDAESAPQVKKTLRQMLKKPDDAIKGVDRVQPAEVKKHFRLKALGKDDETMDEEAGAGEEGTNKLVKKYRKDTPKS